MSRTDELLGQGAKERGGTGGAPFVKWGDAYAWVEGEVVGHWTGDYGDVATLEVSKVSEGLEMAGKDEEGKEYRTLVESGVEVNVGLNSATLVGTIRKQDIGRTFHVAFEGWDTNRKGQRFRMFRVLELNPEPSQNGAISKDQAKKLWQQASEKLAGDPMGEEQAFRHIVAGVTGQNPEDVSLYEIQHRDMPGIMEALRNYENDAEDDLPF